MTAHDDPFGKHRRQCVHWSTLHRADPRNFQKQPTKNRRTKMFCIQHDTVARRRTCAAAALAAAPAGSVPGTAEAANHMQEGS